MARFYITTAIDYANGDPHFGHALEKIGADAIARYRRLRGETVHFLMGMDEHGQKVAQAAAERGLTPQALVDQVAARFEATWKRLDISFDQFIRTTDPAHERGVRALIQQIHERNPDDFYLKSYEGWYCVGCELFKRENEIVQGHCAIHATRELQWTEERNWFFRLTRYEGFLKRLLREHPDVLRPETRRNEILGLLEQGLEDVSITRARLTWAIPFPLADASGEHQGTWVWFDALPNYLTATGYPDPGFTDRWPADVHIVGKDITRLHAVVWPAMLESAGLELPREVWAHGFISFAGERFSKSAGVAIGLDDAIGRFGVDAFRYFLLCEVPFDGDGSFSWERFEDRYHADLANGLGNLASRVLAMVEKYRGGLVPSGPASDLDRADSQSFVEYHAAMNGQRGYLLHEGLRALLQSVAKGNEYIQSTQPWTLAKDPAQSAALDAVLAALVRQLARQAVCFFPFMPGKAAELWAALGAPGSIADQRFGEHADSGAPDIDVTGWHVRKRDGLFPRDTPPRK